MPDMEKVISGLKHCRKYGTLCGLDCNGHYEYTDNLQDIIKANNHRKDCPYGRCRTGCVVTLVDDATALLKAQEAVKPRVSTVEQRCGNCNKVIEMDGWKACPWCGKPILWEAVGRSVK